jgi:hypothetical protein
MMSLLLWVIAAMFLVIYVAILAGMLIAVTSITILIIVDSIKTWATSP